MEKIIFITMEVDSYRFDKILDGNLTHFETKDRLNIGQTFIFRDGKNHRHLYARVKSFITNKKIRTGLMESYLLNYYTFELTGMINVDNVDMPFSTPISTEIYSENPIINLKTLPPVYLINKNGEIIKKYNFEILDTIKNEVIVHAS